MKKSLVVIQEGNKDCGAACLLSVIRYYGGDISLDRLIEMTKTTKEGTNFYNISEAANNFRIMTKCFKIEDIEKLKKLTPPFIVQLKNNYYMHFIVVYKISNNKIIIMDPEKGKMNIDIFDFLNIWTGYIMIFEKIGAIPKYKEEKVLNRIIKNTLIKNVNIIVFLTTLSLIFTLLSCIVNLYSQIVFDNIIDTNLNNLIVVTIFFSVLFIIKNITSFLRNHLVIYLNQKLEVSTILSTYSKIILLPFNFYKNKTSTEILSRINDLSYIKKFISKVIITIFLDSFIFLISFIIIYRISKEIIVLYFFISLIYFITIISFNKIVKGNIIINKEDTIKINNLIIESVSGYETIKGLNIEDNLIFKFSREYSQQLNNLYCTEKTNNIIFTTKELIADIGNLILHFFAIKEIMNNNITIGNYMTITYLSNFLIFPIKNIIDMLNEYHYVKNIIEKGNNLLEYDDEKIYDKEKLLVTGNIIINNLSYTYNNKHKILKNLKLFIRDKERVLLLGPSGTGKSTIMKIIYKYYEVERGKVYINGYDINDYSMSDIRRNITYISQNEILFTDSIRNNILLDRDISEIDFLNICKILHIDEIVENNILGYDYPLEENGSNISGGQRQRIILARSLLKKSNIIMVDEGLNQIDIKLEREILENIFDYFYNKTFIIISHRKDNMDLYNRVIRIDNGHVKEIEERLIK